MKQVFVALIVLLVAVPATGEEKKKKPYRWYVVPNIAFDTDDGLGFGARAELAFDEPGFEPYKMALVVHAFASLNGYHHHRFRLDRTGLGPGGALRVTLHLAWRQWLNDGYWGVGNGTTRERDFARDFDGDDPRRKRYRYTLYQPFAHFTLRGDISGPWSMFAALNAKWSQVETYAGSLLEEQQPFGMDGGLGVILSAGLIYDTRSPEVNPERGIYAELSGRASSTLPDGAGTFAGVYANLKGFLSVTPWLVLCGRFMAEMLWGEVPFYEMVHWGGAWPRAGFGGFETLRGISFGRWRAPGKAILNLEARFRVADVTVWGAPIQWQLALFSDNGVVWGAGDDATAPAPDGIPIHPTVGGGIRAVFQESFVGRIDTGVGIDPVRERDGGTVNEISWGIYIVFDHAF
jgi:outer membrane protein assembly factor BamA